MLIPTCIVALILILMGGTSIFALANSISLEEKLEDALKENARLEEKLGEYKRELLVKRVNEYCEELREKK